MPIKNYTTEISEERTIGEITGLLVAKGARQITIKYDEAGRAEGVSFYLLIEGMPIPFRLPCNFDGVFRYMLRQYKDRSARWKFEQNPESKNQARRIAWRIIKDWVAAQMALIEAEQASMPQIFLPYCTINISGDTAESVTMFDRFMEQVTKQKALPPQQESL